MKKLLIASLITLSSASIFAADNTATAAKTDVFKQAEQLYAAKTTPLHFKKCNASPKQVMPKLSIT